MTFDEWFGSNTKRMIAAVDEKSIAIYQHYAALLEEAYNEGYEAGIENVYKAERG